jgi:uncharacterized protein
MRFEFDSSKSNANLLKHGISFPDATALWMDEKRLIVPAKMVQETRYAIISEYKDKIWTGIFTMRCDVIRIISVRRARRNEREHYFKS